MYELTLKPTEREISLAELKNRIKSVACKFTEKKPEKSAYRPQNFGDVIRDIIYNQPLEQQHEAQFNQRLVEYDARRDTFLKACNVEIDNKITKAIADGRLKVVGETIHMEDLARAHLSEFIETTQQKLSECEFSFYGAALKMVASELQSISLTSSVVTPESGLNWKLRTPKRFQDYGKPLYDMMKAAYDAGLPLPSARYVLDAFAKEKPLGISKVMFDSMDYFNSNGEEETANVDAIRKAIGRLLSK
jgi:hypothetical protein